MQISLKILALFLKKKTTNQNNNNKKTTHKYSKMPSPCQRDPIGKKQDANYLFLCDYRKGRKFEAELPTLCFLKSLVLTEKWY